MIKKTNISSNYKYTKTKLFLLICLISITGCTKTNGAHNETDPERITAIEENKKIASQILPTSERSNARELIEKKASELSSEGIISDPQILSEILEMDETKYFNALILDGKELKKDLNANTNIGGTSLMKSFFKHVLGVDGDKTNTASNGSRREESKKMFNALLRSIPSNNESLPEYAIDSAKGNWAYATETILKKIDENNNTICEETLKLIPIILDKQSEVGATVNNFFGRSKEKRWNKSLELIIEKNKNIIEKNITVHQGFLKGLKDDWKDFTTELAKKLEKDISKIPEPLIKDYQDALTTEIIENKKFNDYAAAKNYIIHKLGHLACTPQSIAASIRLNNKGESILKELLSIKNVDLSTILNNKTEYGDYINVIAFAANNYYSKSSFEETIKQLHINMIHHGLDTEFRTALHQAYDQIAKLSGKLMSKNYSEALIIMKNALSEIPM